MRKVYPIILTPVMDGYVVTVPDLDINTQGKDLADAIYMARDAIGLWGICEQDDGRELPPESSATPECEENEIVTLVDIDFDDYRRRHDMATERTNITLPRYLKKAAEKAGLNFSQELQERLREQLNLK